MKTRRTIKSAVCAVLIAVLLFCTGCDTEIDVYEQQDEDYWYFGIDIGLGNALDKRLNDTAAFSEKHNGKWTVENWLIDYFDELSEISGFLYRYDGIYNDTAAKRRLYSFTVNVPKKTAERDVADGLTLSSDVEQKTNLFVRTINVVRDDRFNYWIKQFGDVMDRFDSDDPQPMDNRTLTGILLFGTRVNGEVRLPGFADAFPEAQTSEATEILLRNFWYASKKMNVAYDNMMPVYNSDGRRDTYGVYYVFEKTVGTGETQVSYEYYRADPTGWYLVAIAVGGITVGICIAIAVWRKRKKNKKPPEKPEDLFPYDPFADFFGNNTPPNANDNDPFAGY